MITYPANYLFIYINLFYGINKLRNTNILGTSLHYKSLDIY